MAINVDLADSAAIDPNRNNNFGLRFERACEIPWIGCDIFNNDGVALSNGCTAYPLCDWNSHVLCRRAAEGPKQQGRQVRWYPACRSRPSCNAAGSRRCEIRRIPATQPDPWRRRRTDEYQTGSARNLKCSS